MIEITPEVVRSGLEALVEEKGEEFFYPYWEERCTYVRDGKPDCIVGCFLANVGVPLARLAEADEGDGTDAFVLLQFLQGEGVITFDTLKVPVALHTAQALQDLGTEWSDAVREALEKFQ